MLHFVIPKFFTSRNFFIETSFLLKGVNATQTLDKRAKMHFLNLWDIHRPSLSLRPMSMAVYPEWVSENMSS